MSQDAKQPLNPRLRGLLVPLERLPGSVESNIQSYSGHLRKHLWLEEFMCLHGRGSVLDAKALALIARCRESLERIDSLLQDAAVWKGEKPPAAVDVQGLLDTMLRLTRVERERTARLEQDFESSLPRVIGGESTLARVFFTLIINALGLMRSAPSRQHVLRVRARRYEGRVLITLSTTGPGIPSELLPRLFDPLCPALVPGSGQWIGLSLSHDCLWRMGGELRVESPPEGGVSFSLLLPVEGRLPEDEAWWRGLPDLIRGEEQRLRALLQDVRNTTRARVACFRHELRSLVVPLYSSVKQLADCLTELEQPQGKHPSRRHPRVGMLFFSVDSLRKHGWGLRHLRCRPPELPRSVDVQACLSEALRLCQGKLLARADRLETDFAPRLPRILGGEKHLRSVFLRLIRLCLHVMPGNYSAYERRLRVSTVREERWVRVTFSFPCYTLSSEVRASIMGSGYTSGAREAYDPPLCHALTEAMGGELQLDTREDTGMSYSMLLPVDPVDDREHRVSPAAAPRLT